DYRELGMGDGARRVAGQHLRAAVDLRRLRGVDLLRSRGARDLLVPASRAGIVPSVSDARLPADADALRARGGSDRDQHGVEAAAKCDLRDWSHGTWHPRVLHVAAERGEGPRGRAVL